MVLPDMGNKNRKRTWSMLAGIVLSILGMVFVLRGTNHARLLAELNGTDLKWVFLAIGVDLINYAVRAFRFRTISGKSLKAGMGFLFPLTAASYLMINAFPLRLGEIYKPYILHRENRAGFAPALGAVAVERILDGSVLVLLLGACALSGLLRLAWWMRQALTMAGLLFVVLLGIVFILSGRPKEELERFINNLVQRMPNLLKRHLQPVTMKIADWLGAADARRRLGIALVQSIFVWLMDAVNTALVGRAMGLNIPPAGYLAVVALPNLVMILPSAPACAGTFHAAVRVCVFAVAGAAIVSADQAAAYAIVLHAQQVLPIALIGLVCMVAVPGLGVRPKVLKNAVAAHEQE